MADKHRVGVFQMEVPLRTGCDRFDAHQDLTRTGLRRWHIQNSRRTRRRDLQYLHSLLVPYENGVQSRMTPRNGSRLARTRSKASAACVTGKWWVIRRSVWSTP